MNFDPFENRLCRDVRNELGHEFISAIKDRDPDRFMNKAGQSLSNYPEPHIRSYVQNRIENFTSAWKHILSVQNEPGAFYEIFRTLWNKDLFFECHEWAEDAWSEADGAQKDLLQGFIMAAVAYEQYSYGRMSSAARLGKKAAGKLNENRALLPESTDIKISILAKALSPISDPSRI